MIDSVGQAWYHNGFDAVVLITHPPEASFTRPNSWYQPGHILTCGRFVKLGEDAELLWEAAEGRERVL